MNTEQIADLARPCSVTEYSPAALFRSPDQAVIQSASLTLRLPKLNDAQEIFENYAGQSEVTKYLTWRPHETVKETAKFLADNIQRWQTATEFSNWLVTKKDGGQIIGSCSLGLNNNNWFLGYVIGKEHWGRGYATEAASVLVDWAIKSAGLPRVWATCDIENNASARVLEKIGMVRLEVLPKWVVHPNISPEPRDSILFGTPL